MSAPKTSGAAHTPAPWFVQVPPTGAAIRIHGEPDGDMDTDSGRPIDCTDYVAEMEDTARADANADRIAACVNALEGISTEALAAFPVGHMTELVLAAGECAKDRASLAALVADLRDALREVDLELRMFLDADMVCDHSVGICACTYNRMRENMRAALSRCEGTTTAEPVSLKQQMQPASTAQPESLSVLDPRCDEKKVAP